MSSRYRNQLTIHVDDLFKMYSRNNRDNNELAVVAEECQSLTIASELKDFYINEMENILRKKSDFDKAKFSKEHLSIKSRALEMVDLRFQTNHIGKLAFQKLSNLVHLRKYHTFFLNVYMIFTV